MYVTLQEHGIGCGYIRLIFFTSKLIYYWHNYAENKSYVLAGRASLGCSRIRVSYMYDKALERDSKVLERLILTKKCIPYLNAHGKSSVCQ